MRQVVDQLQRWNFRLCGVFLLDSQFLIQASKFLAGVMTALSAMVILELPHVNVLSKMDLLDKQAKREIEKYTGLCYYQSSTSFSHTFPPFSPPHSPPQIPRPGHSYLAVRTRPRCEQEVPQTQQGYHNSGQWLHHFSLTRTWSARTRTHTDWWLQSSTVPSSGRLWGRHYWWSANIHWHHHTIWRGPRHQSTQGVWSILLSIPTSISQYIMYNTNIMFGCVQTIFAQHTIQDLCHIGSWLCYASSLSLSLPPLPHTHTHTTTTS